MYDFAVELIKKGVAYVDDSSSSEIAAQKGTVTTPGSNSPYRDRSIEENLELFKGMKEGKYPEGSRVLRAKKIGRASCRERGEEEVGAGQMRKKRTEG